MCGYMLESVQVEDSKEVGKDNISMSLGKQDVKMGCEWN